MIEFRFLFYKKNLKIINLIRFITFHISIFIRLFKYLLFSKETNMYVIHTFQAQEMF